MYVYVYGVCIPIWLANNSHISMEQREQPAFGTPPFCALLLESNTTFFQSHAAWLLWYDGMIWYAFK